MGEDKDYYVQKLGYEFGVLPLVFICLMKRRRQKFRVSGYSVVILLDWLKSWLRLTQKSSILNIDLFVYCCT